MVPTARPMPTYPPPRPLLRYTILTFEIHNVDRALGIVTGVFPISRRFYSTRLNDTVVFYAKDLQILMYFLLQVYKRTHETNVPSFFEKSAPDGALTGATPWSMSGPHHGLVQHGMFLFALITLCKFIKTSNIVCQTWLPIMRCGILEKTNSSSSSHCNFKIEWNFILRKVPYIGIHIEFTEIERFFSWEENDLFQMIV